MICKVCGRTSEKEDANYCYYCGASFREGVEKENFAFKTETPEADSNKENTQYDEVKEVNAESVFSKPITSEKDLEELKKQLANRPVSFGNWLVLMFLPFVPYIGAFIYIGLLFLWAFGPQPNKTLKNWARAMLIVVAIMLVFVAALYSTGMLSMPALLGNLS